MVVDVVCYTAPLHGVEHTNSSSSPWDGHIQRLEIGRGGGVRQGLQVAIRHLQKVAPVKQKSNPTSVRTKLAITNEETGEVDMGAKNALTVQQNGTLVSMCLL